VTDEQIKAAVRKYIIYMYEDDNADCLHEMDEFDEHTAADLFRAYEFYQTAKVTVTWPDDPEGGAREPAGGSPDREAPGGPGLPGGSGEHEPAGLAPYDLTWPYVPAGYELVGHLADELAAGYMELQPDGSLIWRNTLNPPEKEAPVSS
jgi:hypothetical protein